MKLFWVVPECPFPSNTGGRIVMWKRIEYMSKENDIYLFSIVDDEDERQYKEEIEKYCKKVYFFPRSNIATSCLKSIFEPYPAVSRWNKAMKNCIKELYDSVHPDFIIVDFPQMIGVLPRNILKKGRVVLNQHNIEHLSMRSLSNDIQNPFKKFIYKCVAKQMEKYEERIYSKKRILLYTFVSISDKDFFEKKYKMYNTFLVPVGAEIDGCTFLNENNSHNLAFVGKMSYPPNEEGAFWLIDKVFPLINKKVKDAKLFIVGKEPSERLLSRNSESVVITGFVESVVPYYEKCSVIAVPVMTGGGVNVKLLEAIGFGKIVVTTEKGINGTLFKKDEHVLVTDNLEAFADYCINAILYPKTYDGMLGRAKKLLQDNYNWQGIAGSFEKKLSELL